MKAISPGAADTADAARASLVTTAAEFQPPTFDAVYRGWFDSVVRWCRALGGPDMDAEDLAQEVFVVVHRKLAAFDGANLPGWLYRICAFTVSDYRRRSWFRNLFRRRDDDLAEQAGPDWPVLGVEERLDRAEGRRVLHRLLRRLSAAQRAAFVLFEVHGYSGAEIAQLQQVPVATVWTRLHQARRELAAQVGRLQRAGRLP